MTREDHELIRAAAAPGATREQIWDGACAAQRATPGGAAPHYPWPASPAQELGPVVTGGTIWDGLPEEFRSATVNLIMSVDGAGAGSRSADAARDRLIAWARSALPASPEQGEAREAWWNGKTCGLCQHRGPADGWCPVELMDRRWGARACCKFSPSPAPEPRPARCETPPEVCVPHVGTGPCSLCAPAAPPSEKERTCWECSNWSDECALAEPTDSACKDFRPCTPGGGKEDGRAQ